MLWLLVAAVCVGAVFWWLKQTTVKQKTMHTKAFVCMKDLLDFLCRPGNLEKYHPYIQKVTDVQETTELVHFRIEENMGMAGKQVLPMMMRTFRDSQVTARLRFECASNYAKVIITLCITDCTDDDGALLSREAVANGHPLSTSGHPISTSDHSLSTSGHPMSTIQLVIHVEAPRFFNFFIASHLEDVWTKALRKTKSILES